MKYLSPSSIDYRTFSVFTGESDDYILDITGDLYVEEWDEEDNCSDPIKIGTINCYFVNTEEFSALDTLDAHSQELATFMCLYDEDGNYSDRLLNQIYGCERGNNLFVVAKLEILPEYRGRKFGLFFLQKAIRAFANGCSVTAIHPSPLQFCNSFVDVKDEDEKIKIQKQFKKATNKLKEYYSRIGFETLEGTNLMILDLHLKQPQVVLEDGELLIIRE